MKYLEIVHANQPNPWWWFTRIIFRM